MWGIVKLHHRKFIADFVEALILTASQNTFVKYQWEGSQQKCQVLVMYHNGAVG